MNGKILEIIRREYMQRIQKKSFWISTVLMPVLFVGLSLLPAIFGSMNLKKEMKIAVIDQHGGVFERFRKNLSGVETTPGAGKKDQLYNLKRIDAGTDLSSTLSTVKADIARETIEGCLVIGTNFEDKNNFKYYGRNVSNLTMMREIHSALMPIIVGNRLERNHINATPEQVDQWTKEIELETFQVKESGETNKSGFGSAYLITFVFIFILYLSLIIYGIANLRGILEEKTSRIIEVLLATFTSRQLMTGKLLGIGLVGLTQITVYALSIGVVALSTAVPAMAASPELGEILKSINPIYLVYFIVFFVLGYLIYSAMFLGIGSICSSEEDAQNMQMPVIMMLVVPFMFVFFFINNPDSTPAVIASLIPAFTPMVMMMRILVLTPPLWQILLSIALCIAFIAFLLWAVAKVFQIGVLSYGKRPTFTEIVRWLRETR